jgi:CheY-like chemotaxis protein
MARILIADDDDDVRELIELALEGQGHHVDSVGAGQAALALLGQYKYDLVVCDLHMPGVDGPALYGTAQRQLASVPSFIFITGYAAVGPYEDFIRTTQAPVLGKPFDIQALRETVRRVVSGF